MVRERWVGARPTTTAVPKHTRQLFLALALLTLAVYLVSARGLPNALDEQVISDTTGSLVHGKATINTPLLTLFPGLGVKRSDGKTAGIYGLGTSIAGAPFYEAGQIVASVSPHSKRSAILATATLFTNAFITAASVFLLMLVCFLLGAPPRGAALIGLSFGLGSYAYPHAITLFSEPGTALSLIAAVLFAIRASRTGLRSDLIACGACAGTALIFRISAALFLPLFGVWLLVAAGRSRHLRRSVIFGAWFTAGAAAPLALLLLTNSWRYGSLFDFGYGADATKQSYPIVRGFLGMWASSGKSLFLYAPIAVVAVIGLGRSLRKLPLEIVLLGGIVLANSLFFARVQFWSGDWAWGPRYMQIVLPCLAAMAAPLMASPAWRRALIALSVFGLLISALPAVAIPFSLIFRKAAHFMPPGDPLHGPPVWDHSYYALIWHTWDWQPILFQLRLIPHAIGNTFWHAASRPGKPNPPISARDPRIEFWWLRLHSIGYTAALFFAAWPAIAGVAGVRMLRSARRSQPSTEPHDQLAEAG